MRFFLAVVLGLSLMSSSVFAFEKLDRKELTCEQIKEVIQTDGAVLLEAPEVFGWHILGWQTYVKNGSFCPPPLGTKSKFVPNPAWTWAKDGEECLLTSCVLINL